MFTQSIHSPLGHIIISAKKDAICSVLFSDTLPEVENVPNEMTAACAQQIEEYFNGERKAFDLPLAPQGTDFQKSVWDQLQKIPFGKTDTYSGIAFKLNNPLSVRAVGTSNGKNPIAIIIPCHRIIGADGSLTGYAGGIWRKEKLLQLEGSRSEQFSIF